MASNVEVEYNHNRDYTPSRKASTEKIDGIVALIMAVDLAMRFPDFASAPVVVEI